MLFHCQKYKPDYPQGSPRCSLTVFNRSHNVAVKYSFCTGSINRETPKTEGDAAAVRWEATLVSWSSGDCGYANSHTRKSTTEKAYKAQQEHSQVRLDHFSKRSLAPLSSSCLMLRFSSLFQGRMGFTSSPAALPVTRTTVESPWPASQRFESPWQDACKKQPFGQEMEIGSLRTKDGAWQSDRLMLLPLHILTIRSRTHSLTLRLRGKYIYIFFLNLL